MKKVKYTGDQPVIFYTLGILAAKGDVVEVPDDFEAANFEDVPTKTKADK